MSQEREERSTAPRSTLRIEVAPRTFVLALTCIAGVWLAFQLWTVVLVMLVSLVLVGTFVPLVGWLERRGIGRGRALALIFLVIALGLAAVLLLTIPPLVAQLQHIVEDAPETERRKLLNFLSQYKSAAPLVQKRARRAARRSRRASRHVAAQLLRRDPHGDRLRGERPCFSRCTCSPIQGARRRSCTCSCRAPITCTARERSFARAQGDRRRLPARPDNHVDRHRGVHGSACWKRFTSTTRSRSRCVQASPT